MVFFASLLLFLAVLPQFGIYIALLCAGEWSCIFLYGRRENRPFFLRVLLIGSGNLLAFMLRWYLLGREVSPVNLDLLEILLLTLLLAGGICILMILVLAGRKAAGDARAMKKAEEALGLFPEREYDLQRLEGFLRSGTQLIGIDALWGDGKTFLIDRLCSRRQIQDYYEVVRINALAGNEDEVELELMNEFDRILRRNHIFSLASKQMLKLLENNDILKQLQWLLIEDTQSVSTTFSSVLSDLEKLRKHVLIVVDDIERLGDQTLIRKLFALMESVSSRRVQIIYLFNSAMLTGFDRNYLEKYIPCYMTLTPIRFRSIVQAFWDELQMDATGMACSDVERIAEFPKSSNSMMQILAQDPGETYPFRLDHFPVRRVRVFLEEFRNLVSMKRPSEHGTSRHDSDTERQLFLRCLFIKHFLPQIFEKLTIGTSIADTPLFRLDEEAQAILRQFGLDAPANVTLLYLLGIRRQLHRSEDMQRFMRVVLADQTNYNCLTALSMLEFDYGDIWKDVRKAEQPRTQEKPIVAANVHESVQDLAMKRAEQIGNEDISDIARERNNERIDRIMWNLLANGTSEMTNFDAYVMHFREVVLAAPPDSQQKAWQQFSSDAYYRKIYKNNTTQDRFGVDPYLPLFKDFRVTNAPPDDWLKLLAFYFRSAPEDHDAISVEMIQNLNYVDMMDRRVYIAVLRYFSQCRIIGNLNAKPCMYRFLRQTLHLPYSFGYTKNHVFHDVWYDIKESQDADNQDLSQQCQDAVLSLAKQFEAMKRGLEKDKLPDPGLQWFNSELEVIMGFIDKCQELVAKERTIRMRTLHVNVKESSVSRHQTVCDALQTELQSGVDRTTWLEHVHSAYEEGRLDPLEIRRLIKAAEAK